jgi:5-oxoprolinase (ATP-hydrolysing)
MDVRFIFIYQNFFLVSQDPGNYDDAPTEGIRRVLEIVTGQKIPRTSILETDKIGALSSNNHLLEKNIHVTVL